jgi:hypothetical protein
MKHRVFFAAASVLIACADQDESDQPAVDVNAPRVDIVAPARGTIAGDVTEIGVAGTVIDDSGYVTSVTVNGVPASLGYGGTWSARVSVTPGTTLLHVVATDSNLNQTTATRAVVVGPMASLDQRVVAGIRAMVSSEAASAFAREAAAFISNDDLSPAVTGMQIVNTGADCNFARATISNLTVADATVHIDPTTNGMAGDVTLDDLRIGMRLQWSDACVEGTRDVVVTARSAAVGGVVVLAGSEGKLRLHLEDRAVELTGLDIELAGVPDKIAQMLALDDAMKPALGAVTERLLGQPLVEPLARLYGTRTIEATTIEVDATPTQVTFTADAGLYSFDTLLRARGAQGQFVFVPNPAPKLTGTLGFEVALSDDTANQLLTSMWSAHAFDAKLALDNGTYGAISEHYDTAELTLVVPPHVDASTDAPRLTYGDWIARLQRGDTVAQVAIHATNRLYVVKREDGRLHFDVSPATIDIDIIGGNTPVTKGQYEAIKTFAFARIHASSKAALATIPMPVLGDPVLTNLWLESADGYLLIRGDVQ